MAEIREERPAMTVSVNEMILMQLRDLKDSQRDLKVEIKDIRQELKDVRQELNEMRKELNGRIDKLADKIDASSNHGQISTITTIGIALGVLYALLFK